MTDMPDPTVSGGVPAWATDLGRSVLMSLGAGIIAHGYVSGAQWAEIVGGLIAALSALWSYLARHPAKGDPLAFLRARLAAGGGSNSQAYDGALTAGEAYALAQALPVLNKVLAAHVPRLIRAPVLSAVDREARSLADRAVSHLEV